MHALFIFLQNLTTYKPENENVFDYFFLISVAEIEKCPRSQVSLKKKSGKVSIFKMNNLLQILILYALIKLKLN